MLFGPIIATISKTASKFKFLLSSMKIGIWLKIVKRTFYFSNSETDYGYL